MSAKRVVVTGLGTTSPVGGDVPSTWAALLAGQSGVGPIKHEWAEQLGTQIAAEVAVDPTDVLDRVKARRLDRSGQLALVAALEAWADSGLGGEDASPVDPERLGVAMASGIGGVQTLLHQLRPAQGEGPAPGLAAGDPDADAQLPRREHRPGHRRQGRRAHAGLGVRVGQRGDRARHRHDPARSRRRRRGRWHRGRGAPAADGRVRPDDGAVEAQRRPRCRLAAVGQGPRRLRARRGRGRARARVRGARRGARGHGCTPRRRGPASPPTPTTSRSPTRPAWGPPGR